MKNVSLSYSFTNRSRSTTGGRRKVFEMKRLFDPKLQSVTYELFAGEFLATAEQDVVLITLLGSCVAVCLFDEKNGVIGMNHFMLPGRHNQAPSWRTSDAKYGIAAMNHLLEAMVRKGADKDNLKAKVFGAGRVVEHFTTDIASSNEHFAKRRLAELKIPMVAADLGGNSGRKIYFFSRTQDVYLKRISDPSMWM